MESSKIFYNNLIPNKKLALISESGDHLSYGELENKSSVFQKKFHSKKTVFCLFNNDVESIISYIALLNNDNKIFLIDNKIPLADLSHLIELYKPAYILTKENFFISDMNYHIEDEYGDYTIFRRDFEDFYEIFSDLSILLSTSGSTGSPKFVRISKENLLANAISIIDSLKINSNSLTITNLSMNYSYGLSIINTFLYARATLIVSSHSLTSKNFWQVVQAYKPNFFNGIPYHYDLICKFGDNFFSELPFQFFTQAGGRMSDQTKNKIVSLCLKNSKKLFLMYGQTEATARISVLPSDCVPSKKNSVGKSIPGGKIEVQSPNGQKIDTSNTPGEIVYHGKNVSLGYCTSIEDLARGNDNNFILFTGDIGYMDSDNFLYLIGRRSRFIKFLGNRLSLDDIESKLSDAFGMCACLGENEKLVIFFDKVMNQKEIDNFLYEKLKFKLLIEIITIENIPRTGNGKINYNFLQNLYKQKRILLK